MLPALLIALASVLAANPLPNSKSPIDSLQYTFGNGGAFGAGGNLSISADGKVAYFYSSDPDTGSGGRVVRKNWELSKEERTELFRKLVTDGLLDAEEGKNFFSQIRVTYGRWGTTFAADKVPDKALAHLRPLLSKADPVLWPEKKPEKEEPPAKPGTLTSVSYYFANAANGDQTTLDVSRDGKVRYTRQAPAPAKPIEVEWTIPTKDAEALLDALAADGLFDAEGVPGDKFPLLTIHAQAGRWRTKFHPKELPEKAAKQLLPLLRKADPDFWK